MRSRRGVDQDVEPAEGLHRAPYHGFDFLLLAQVHPQGQGLAAGRPHPLRRDVRVLLLPVGAYDVGPFGSERLADDATELRVGPGYDGDLVLQAHMGLLEGLKKPVSVTATLAVTGAEAGRPVADTLHILRCTLPVKPLNAAPQRRP